MFSLLQPYSIAQPYGSLLASPAPRPKSTAPTLSLKLQIQPGNVVIVPGCEPTSAVTSYTLLRNFRCTHPTARVDDILAAIPGTKIVYFPDFGARERYIELPPIDMACPCGPKPDYYAILRSIASGDLPVEEKVNYCDINDMGYCPSPDFRISPRPEASPYISEGTLPFYS